MCVHQAVHLHRATIECWLSANCRSPAVSRAFVGCGVDFAGAVCAHVRWSCVVETVIYRKVICGCVCCGEDQNLLPCCDEAAAMQFMMVCVLNFVALASTHASSSESIKTFMRISCCKHTMAYMHPGNFMVGSWHLLLL